MFERMKYTFEFIVNVLRFDLFAQSKNIKVNFEELNENDVTLFNE